MLKGWYNSSFNHVSYSMYAETQLFTSWKINS